MSNLNEKNILIIATNGFQEDELFEPMSYFKDKGSNVHLASPKMESISAGEGASRDITPDMTLDDVKVENYHGLILPGGLANPDTLRTNDKAISLIREFGEAGKPIAAVCHGPWLLIEAGLAKGREMTSYKSIKTDLENAGAKWTDQAVVCDNAIVTSRNPGDLKAFNAKFEEEILEGRHERDGLKRAA